MQILGFTPKDIYIQLQRKYFDLKKQVNSPSKKSKSKEFTPKILQLLHEASLIILASASYLLTQLNSVETERTALVFRSIFDSFLTSDCSSLIL